MKTTLDLDADLIASAQRAVALPVFERGSGLASGIDPLSNNAMLRALDGVDHRDFKKLLGRTHFTLLHPAPR